MISSFLLLMFIVYVIFIVYASGLRRKYYKVYFSTL